MHAPVRVTLGRAATPVLCVIATLSLILAAAPARAAAAPPTSLRVGSLTLKPLRRRAARLVVRAPAAGARSRAAVGPADPGRAALAARDRRVARTARRSSPSRAARATRRSAAGSSTPGIYGPLLKRRSLLLVDNRGTGGSALIDCPMVQTFAGVTSSDAFPARAAPLRAADRPRSFGAGARQPLRDRLRGRRPRRGHARAEARAGRPLRRLLRHLLRAVVHGAPPGPAALGRPRLVVRGPRPRPVVRVVRARPRAPRSTLVCARDAGCAGAAPGSASERLAQLLATLRRAPITGSTRDADGSKVRARVDARAVVDLVQDAGSDPVDLPRARRVGARRARRRRGAAAAPRRPVAHLRPQPELGRLLLERPLPRGRVRGLPAAVLDDARRPRRAAASSRRACRARRRPTFAPFTLHEWLTRQRLHPALPRLPGLAGAAPARAAAGARGRRAAARERAGADARRRPRLADAARRRRGVRAERSAATTRIVTLRNTVHVTTEGDTYLVAGADCGRQIIRGVRQRVRRSSRTLDARCAERHPAGPHARRLPAAVRRRDAGDARSGRRPG